MKILFYIESLRAGGKERRLVELIKGLKSFYPDVEMELVLTKKDIHYRDIFDTGIKIHYTFRKGIKKDPRLFWMFYKIAKEFKPDIIHSWGNMATFYAIPTKLLLGIPLINSQITDAPPVFHNKLLNHRINFLFSDLIIANSNAGLKAYKAPTKKSIVIYNGFDFNRIKRLVPKVEIRKKFNIKTKFIVGMIASFSPLKDYKTYILGAQKFLEKNKNVTFLCIGDGNYSEFQKLIFDRFKSNILFLGKQDNVESIMNICDIGVLITNSELHGEGISNSLLEFMALKKPVIATDNGGTNELISNNENGFLIGTKDPDVLAEKINILINNGELMINMGLKSKVIVKNKFGIERMIYEYINIYEKLYNKVV